MQLWPLDQISSSFPNLHLVGAEAGYERGSPHSWANLQGLVFMRRIRGGYEKGTRRIQGVYEEDTRRIRGGYVDGTWRVRGGYEEDTRRIQGGYIEDKIRGGYEEGTLSKRSP